MSYNVVYKFTNVFPSKTGFQVKQGIPVPFAFKLPDSANKAIVTAAANNPGKCLVIAGIGSNTNAFTYVSQLKVYGCALDTKNLAVGTHAVEIRLDDGTTQTYSIKILKK